MMRVRVGDCVKCIDVALSGIRCPSSLLVSLRTVDNDNCTARHARHRPQQQQQQPQRQINDNVCTLTE